MDVIQDVTLWISNLYLVLAPKVGAKPSGLILHVRFCCPDLVYNLAASDGKLLPSGL